MGKKSGSMSSDTMSPDSSAPPETAPFRMCVKDKLPFVTVGSKSSTAHIEGWSGPGQDCKMAGAVKLLARNFCSKARLIRLASELNHKGYFNTEITKISPSQIISYHSFPNCRHDFSLQFRQLQPRKDDSDGRKEDGDSPPKRPLEFFDNLSKSFLQLRKKDETPKKKRIPKLILLQNPLTWLMIKIDFRVLKSVWDPTFVEREFKYGTKQAISRVTHVISEGNYAELNGLLTKAARTSLLRELERNWGERQRSLLALSHDDIQISSPRKVYFIRIADKKFCDVDMAFLALKWAPVNSIESLLFAEIFARFHREYTPHSIPEWTIAYFKVTRFEILRRSSR